MFNIGLSFGNDSLNGFHVVETQRARRPINMGVEIFKKLIAEYDLVVTGQTSNDEFLRSLQWTNVELDVDLIPCHTHTPIGESNTKGVVKRMRGESLFSCIRIRTKVFGSTAIDECRKINVRKRECVDDY